MPNFAVAMHIAVKDAGPYSRTLREYLDVQIVEAVDPHTAYAQTLTTVDGGGRYVQDYRVVEVPTTAPAPPAAAPSEPGRELDALVAERVMGWSDVGSYDATAPLRLTGVPPGGFPWSDVPHYSTDIAAAWEVAEFLGLALVPQSYGDGFRWLCCDLDRVRYQNEGTLLVPKDSTERSAPTAPHAICLAALAAIKADDARP